MTDRSKVHTGFDSSNIGVVEWRFFFLFFSPLCLQYCVGRHLAPDSCVFHGGLLVVYKILTWIRAVALFHPSGTLNFEFDSRFLEELCTLGDVYYHIKLPLEFELVLCCWWQAKVTKLSVGAEPQRKGMFDAKLGICSHAKFLLPWRIRGKVDWVSHLMKDLCCWQQRSVVELGQCVIDPHIRSYRHSLCLIER